MKNMSKPSKRTACLLLACCMLLSLSACRQVEELLEGAPKDALVINEVVTSNQLSLQDEVYGSPDWIELYNGSDQSIHLSSFYITDTVEAPQKAFQLPDVELSPGEFFLLYGTKKAGPANLGFSLKKEGETITLLDARMEDCSKAEADGSWTLKEESLCGRYPRYLECTKPGGTLRFRFTGRRIDLYWMMAKDSGDALCKVDDRPETALSSWDSYCKRFDRANAACAAKDLPFGEHTLTLRLSPVHAEESEGTALRIAAFLIM